MPVHGYQITYFQDQHTSWLWYPGNAISLRAEVKFTESQVCFTYSSKTRNRATGKRGGQPSCIPKNFLEYTKAAERTGDVFGLARGTVPYVRGKCDPTDKFRSVNVDADLLRIGCS
jgi:hypothetical protein